MPLKDFQAGSSPLSSRANPVIYAVLIVAAVIIFIAFLIWSALKILKKYRTSDKYIESQKNKISSYADIKNFCAKFKLSQKEQALLWKIFKKYHIVNIFYTIKDYENLSRYFKSYYIEKKSEFSDDDEEVFFSLLFNIEKICSGINVIKSTKSIPQKTKLFYINNHGVKFSFDLEENTKSFMFLKPSEQFIRETHKPEETEKILFTFTSETKMQYGFISRIIRYRRTQDGNLQLIISHPNILYKQIKRNFKRRLTSKTVEFSSAKISENKKDFIFGEKQYFAKVTNISAGGLCLVTDLPIKQNQFLKINLSPFDIQETVIGKIISTRNTIKKGYYNLHIKFVKISKKSQNKIQRTVFGYEQDTESV